MEQPNDVKALLRRAQAFEAVERYKMALQDVRHMLSMPREEIGESNLTVRAGGRDGRPSRGGGGGG
jgi:hypothetical protein